MAMLIERTAALSVTQLHGIRSIIPFTDVTFSQEQEQTKTAQMLQGIFPKFLKSPCEWISSIL